MSRKLEQVDSSSSYDLMLDVLSNVFGGVILISCLLAILPRHVAPPPLLSADLAKQEMTERRIAMAESELDQILIQTQRLEDRTSSELVTALSERVALKKILESLNTELATIRELELKLVDDKVTPMKGTVRRADQQLRNIKTQLIAAEKLNRALKEKLKMIKKEAEGQKSEKGEGEYYYVQLPQEKGALVNPFPIIIRHGKIYPTNVGSTLNRNKALRRTMIDEDVERVIPISSQGWLLPRDVKLLSATLRAAVSQNYSVSVYLYPDSYDVFQDFKNELFKAKIRYGVEFLKVGHTMRFSSKGSSPQEL
jgi:hypothetical protein